MSDRQEQPIAPPSWPFSPAILAIWLVGFLPLESAPIWIPAAQLHYHVSRVAMGELASMQFVAAAIAAMFLAPRIGRLRLRAPMLVAMTAALLACLATAALKPSFEIFCALRMVDGLTAGLCVACAAVLANRTGRPSRSFGAMQFGQIIANMVVFGASTRLVATYGMAGVYALLSAGIVMLTAVVFFHKGWAVAIVPRPPVARGAHGTIPVRIILGCVGIAVVYAGFIGMVTNATALGDRAGIGFQQVTVVLALTTPFSALGALLATILAGRVSAAALVGAGALGTAACGLALVFTGYGFTSLTAAMCGVIFFIYIGFPSIYAGIARLDITGRSSARAQAAQLFGPVFGPAVGAVIAAHSVTGFAAALTIAIAGGIALAFVAVWPALIRELAQTAGDGAEQLGTLPDMI